MDISTAKALANLNNAFYSANHESFSATRQRAWTGWRRVAQAIAEPPRSVLDVACGNLRFKEFLNRELGIACDYHAVDACADLMPAGGNSSVQFQQLDIVDRLIEGNLPASLAAPACDLTVCFGFMHHVPTSVLRTRLLEALLQKTNSGGIVAVSFWQFANDDKLRAKAKKATAQFNAQFHFPLEDGDYLVGWNDLPGAARYCHSFSDAEVDSLAETASAYATLESRFSADGRTGNTNSYLVLRCR